MKKFELVYSCKKEDKTTREIQVLASKTEAPKISKSDNFDLKWLELKDKIRDAEKAEELCNKFKKY